MVNYLILTFLIIFGVITSYEDFKYKIVRNKWILLGIIFGAIFALTYSLNFSFAFTSNYVINALISIAFGYMLWYVGLWSAGDAKLFIAYSFIIFPIVYKVSYISYFPSFSILVNTFVPLLVFYIIYIPFKAGPKRIGSFLLNVLSLRILVTLSLFIFGFGWIIEIILKALKIPSNFFIGITFMFLFLFLLNKGLKLKAISVGFVICIVRVFVQGTTAFSLHSLYNFALMLLTFLALRFYLIGISYELFSKEIKISEIKEGMIPAEDIIQTRPDCFEKRTFLRFSLIGAMMIKGAFNSVFSYVGDGMTKKDIKKIKSIHNKGFLKEDKIRVFEALPFAPFMFFGCLLIVIFGADIIILFRALIESFI